jgi:rhomboid protease GluP
MSMEEEQPLKITPDMLLGRRVDFERRMHRRPPVTLGIIAVLALVFIVEVARGAIESGERLVALGALSRAEIFDGQWWRLESATWLHGGTNHLVSNAIALFILGMICEHAFGRSQYFLLYVLSGLGGSVLSLLNSDGPSVGASGAIFGLQGAAIVLFRQHRERILMRDRRIGVVLLVWALYSIVTGWTSPYIDNGAHIGGALTGALIARRLHPVALDPMSPERARATRRGLWIVGAILAYTVVKWIAWVFWRI